MNFAKRRGRKLCSELTTSLEENPVANGVPYMIGVRNQVEMLGHN
jgi:hypothetical protein